ncbi:MAG: dihydrodipicolinate synthase family protein [Rhodospirillales bacterium]|nr:dihydrodipicolinate synthase family protein [Rhodospirillales bacterium]
MTNTTFHLEGVFSAALTPLQDDLSPDLDKLVQHSKWLLTNGCDGLAPLGTTGEANSFSVAERLTMMEALADGGLPMDRLMPGTGCCAIPDSVELCNKALETGAAGVLMLPPFYYKKPSDDGLFAAFSEVIERVGDDRLKVYLYHFPVMSTVPFSYDLIGRLLARYPDTVVGMKDSSGDLGNMTGAAKEFPGFAVFSGSDELLLPHLKEGGAGCITAVSNVAASMAAEVYAAFKKGEDPTAVHEMLTTWRKSIYIYPLSMALKTIMARHTGDKGWLNIRPPFVQLTDAQCAELFAALDATDYHIPSAA